MAFAGKIGAMQLLRRLSILPVLAIIISLSLAFSACARRSIETSAAISTIPPTQTSAPSPTLPPSPTPAPSATPTPAPPQRTAYTLNATLDYDLHQLQVDGKIDYINPSPDTLTELYLMVDPLYYPGTFQLGNLNWSDGSPVEDVLTERGWLRFPLKQPLPPGERVDLSISYQLNLPSPQPSAAIRPIPFGYTERQTNLVDWYPFVPPYIPGAGWLAHPAGYYGEHLAYDKADFRVNIRLVEPRPDLTVVASTAATQEGDWLRYQHLNARNFAWSVSPYYQALSKQIGPITVTSYAFSGQEQASQAVLDTTAEAVELYSRLFGEYPRRTLNVVEADFLDGMEYDGMYFLSKGFYNLYTGTPAEYLIAIAAHETAHQWWYAALGNDQALEPWLDEALSTYSERLYYENLHPEALDWWWDYRVNYYLPRGWVDTSIYNPHGDAEPYRAYRDAVYLNGAVFLEELRQTIGDKPFFDFLHQYVVQNTDHQVSKQNFFDLLDDYSATDLSSLVKKYFYNVN